MGHPRRDKAAVLHLARAFAGLPGRRETPDGNFGAPEQSSLAMIGELSRSGPLGAINVPKDGLGVPRRGRHWGAPHPRRCDSWTVLSQSEKYRNLAS